MIYDKVLDIGNNKIIYVIVIFVILTLIYTICFSESDASKRRAAHNLLSKSSGLNDDKSKKAKKKSKSIKNKTSKDEFLTTRVEHLNEHNDQHITKDVIDGYTETLKRLVEEDPNEIVTAGGLDNVNDVNIPQRDFIVDAMDHFVRLVEQRAQPRVFHPLDPFNVGNYQNGFDDEQIELMFAADDGMMIPVGGFLNYAETALPLVRERTIQERKKEAKFVSKNKEEEISHFLKDSHTNTNDPQNAHDVQVNKDIKNTFDKIANDRMPFPAAESQAKAYIEKNKDISKEQKEKALRALGNISKYNRSVSILGNGGSEHEVFARVWGRSSARGNEKNKDLMREAVVYALASSVENDNVVCPNGTTSRLLEAPVTLDKDESVGKVNTLENIKNMIFDKAHIILNKSIEEAKKSDDEKMFAVGMSYEDPKIETDMVAQDMFEEKLKEKLDTMLGEEAKQHNIDEHNINIFREQLHAAVI